MNLGKYVFDDNNQERKSWCLFGSNLFHIFNCAFVPTFCDFVDYLWLLLPNSSFKNLRGIYCLGGNSAKGSRIHFTVTNTMNKLVSTTNRVLVSLVGPSETGKSQLNYNWLKNGTFQPKFDKICFLSTISDTL